MTLCVKTAMQDSQYLIWTCQIAITTNASVKTFVRSKVIQKKKCKILYITQINTITHRNYSCLRPKNLAIYIVIILIQKTCFWYLIVHDFYALIHSNLEQKFLNTSILLTWDCNFHIYSSSSSLIQSCFVN